MTLSARALAMLARYPRRPHPTDRATIAAACAAANLPVSEALFAFAERYGGVTFRERGCRSHEMRLALLWPPPWDGVGPPVEDGPAVEVDWWRQDDGPYLYLCAEHKTGQVNIYQY